jgi:hypothetical protein
MSALLTAAVLREVEERADEAVAGPWRCARTKPGSPRDVTILAGHIRIADYANIGNAKFIAHAREDVPHLIATVRAQQAALEAARKVLVPAMHADDPRALKAIEIIDAALLPEQER